MVTLNYANNTLCIKINTTAPDEYRESLMKSIAASMRWRAQALQEEMRDEDLESQIILSELLESLIVENNED